MIALSPYEERSGSKLGRWRFHEWRSLEIRHWRTAKRGSFLSFKESHSLMQRPMLGKRAGNLHVPILIRQLLSHCFLDDSSCNGRNKLNFLSEFIHF